MSSFVQKYLSKQHLLSALCLASLSLSGFSWAETPSWNPQALSNNSEQHTAREKMKQELFDKLGVTAEQQKQLKSIREQNRTQAQQLRQSLHEKRKALMDYVRNPQAKEAQALSMQQEIAGLQSKLGALRIKTVFQMKSILSPEQFNQFSDMMKEHHEAHGRKNLSGKKSTLPTRGKLSAHRLDSETQDPDAVSF